MTDTDGTHLPPEDDDLVADARGAQPADRAPDAAPRPPRRARRSDRIERPLNDRPRHGRRPAARERGDSQNVDAAPSAGRPGRSHPRTRVPARVRAGIAFGVLAVIVAALAFGWWNALYRPEANVASGKHVTITIAKGATGDAVASQLAKAGVVANALMFRVRAQALGATGDLMPGTYEMVTGSSYDGVIRMLQAGPHIDYVTFTVPEGWGIPAIAARVEAKFHIPAKTFEDLALTGKSRFAYSFLSDDPTPSLEGYLFPKTYTLRASATATDVINVMLAQYQKETSALDYSYAASKNLTPHDVLTIASIIEREAVLQKDRPNVASVIYNRLHLGMRLQLDSTVQYSLGGKAKLTLDDLKTQSPYNTYANAGLPPGPICNPGLPSIQAALHPTKTNYLYYILTHKDGSQSFTSSYAQFLQYKQRLQQKGLQ